MININLELNRELYTDYIKSLEFLRKIKKSKYVYPEHTIFHTYSDIKTEKELMLVKSYIATQNLNKTELIVWSDCDLSTNNLLKPYLKYITIKKYNAALEIKNTPLEHRPDLIKVDDERHWMSSGILRFLVTYKYGGVWLDMDTVLFRDLVPILDQEYAYMWGSELDFENFGPCAAEMNFKKESELSTICLEEILKTNIEPNTTCLDKDLLAKVYKRKKFTIFPSTFFDTEWQMNVWYDENGKQYNPNGLGTQIEQQWFTQPLQNMDWLFREAFMWHWHNTTHKNDIIHPQSKFGLWQTIIDNKLKGIL